MEEAPEPEPEWECLMRFLDQSESFAKGFECGRYWEILKTPGDYELTVSWPCEDQMLMIFAKMDYEVVSREKLDDYWLKYKIKLRS